MKSTLAPTSPRLGLPARGAALAATIATITTTTFVAQTLPNERAGLIAGEFLGPNVVIHLTNDTIFSDVGILPGTIFQAESNVTITVLTTVRAAGTAEAPIIFEPASPAAGWAGLFLENTLPGSVFDGCIIRGARNSGVRCIRSTPEFRNSCFTNNTGPFGGALSLDLSRGTLILSNCTFLGNTAANDGGAIWSRGGTSRLDLAYCTFRGNIANPDYQRRHSSGGALCLEGQARLVGCVFADNQVRAYTIYISGGRYAVGGAISAQSATVDLVACRFVNNSCLFDAHYQTPDASHAFGGAIYAEAAEVRLRNVLIADCWLSAYRNPDPRGSALYLASGLGSLTNCTIVRNSTAPALHNAAGELVVDSSIVYWNHDHVTQIAGPATVRYSDIQGDWSGTGDNNIDYNPALGSDDRPLQGSPAIDGGNPDAALRDVFPPGLGSERGDMGLTGGPAARRDLPPQASPTEVIRVETAQVIHWPSRQDLVLEQAATPAGPWSVYSGEILVLGDRHAARINPTDPQRYFRLLKP